MLLTTPSNRKEFQGFAAYYESEIAPFLNQQEGARQLAVKRFLTILAATGAVAAVVFFLLPVGEIRFHGGIITAVIGGGAGFALLQKSRSKISHGLFDRICRHFSYRYRQDLSRPSYYEPFRRLKLLPGHNRENWEDEISGAREGVDFVFCEAHLRKESSGRKKRTRTVFHGQLIVLDYHKEFLGETVVRRDAGMLNRLMKPGKEFKQVGITSSKFEKIFEAWSTDQVEARDLLDPVVLERFEELDRLFGGAKIRAAFTDGKLIVALETGDKLNMGSMFTPLPGADRVEKILKEFDVLFDLMDVLVKRVDRPIDGAFSVGAVRA